MWRGAALDHFAEIEAITLSWLITLDAAGKLGIAPGDFVAWNRFKRLATILADARFSPFNGKVLLLLDALEGEHDLRIALAHGRMKASGTGITLHWNALDRGKWGARSVSVNWFEALRALRRLAKLRHDLASQLGQIKRHCPMASPAL